MHRKGWQMDACEILHSLEKPRSSKTLEERMGRKRGPISQFLLQCYIIEFAILRKIFPETWDSKDKALTTDKTGEHG